MNPDRVSVIIPSLNSTEIDQVLHHLRQQSAWSAVAEILVVGKDELQLVKNDSVVRLIDTGEPVTAARARNIGIEASQSDLLLFLDSDCLPSTEWLIEHMEAHRSGHSVVGGGVLPVGSNYWALSYNLTIFHEFLADNPVSPRYYLPTLNLSIERKVIDDVGYLNENLSRGQDIEWTLRMRDAGHQPFFWPKATVRHIHNRVTFYAIWRDCARSGFFMRQVRLSNPTLMQAPSWLSKRRLTLVLSPLIAAAVTLRIVAQRPLILRRFSHTLPAIYLTKVAWCWGASQGSEPS